MCLMKGIEGRNFEMLNKDVLDNCEVVEDESNE